MNSSRSVLLVISNLGLGGAERQAFYLAVGLRKRGWEVTIASMIPWLAPSFQVELEATGVRFEILQTEVAARPRVLLRTVRALAGLMSAGRPDVIIGFMPHGTLLARIMGRLWRVPKIITSLRCERSTRGWHNWLLALTRRLDHASVANSNAAKTAQLRWGLTSAAKSVVILNGFDTSRVDSMNALAKGNRTFTWLNIGVLRQEKDHETLLAAARELSRTHDFQLLIVGEGPLAEVLEQRAAQLGLDDHVRFLGKKSEIVDLVRGSDAFVMSSPAEGLPNVLLEAHGGGLPIVATRVGGCVEIVEDGETGYLVPPSDPARLAEGMRRMMDIGPEARARMGAAGRARVLSTFSMEKMVDGWASLISR